MTGIINSVILNAPNERAATSPEFVKTRAMLTEVFESDFDLLTLFATQLLLERINSGIRHDKQRELTEQLLHNGRFSKEWRLRFSHWETKFGRDDPILSTIVAFYAGMGQAKVVQGKKGGMTRAGKFNPNHVSVKPGSTPRAAA